MKDGTLTIEIINFAQIEVRSILWRENNEVEYCYLFPIWTAGVGGGAGDP